MGRAQGTAQGSAEVLDLPVETDPDLFEVRQSDAFYAASPDYSGPARCSRTRTRSPRCGRELVRAPGLVTGHTRFKQPIVRRSVHEPAATLAINVLDTAHVLDAVRAEGVAAVVVVTSDQCYAARGSDHAHREEDALGGRDTCSASKGRPGTRGHFLPGDLRPAAGHRARGERDRRP